MESQNTSLNDIDQTVKLNGGIPLEAAQNLNEGLSEESEQTYEEAVPKSLRLYPGDHLVLTRLTKETGQSAAEVFKKALKLMEADHLGSEIVIESFSREQSDLTKYLRQIEKLVNSLIHTADRYKLDLDIEKNKSKELLEQKELTIQEYRQQTHLDLANKDREITKVSSDLMDQKKHFIKLQKEYDELKSSNDEAERAIKTLTNLIDSHGLEIENLKDLKMKNNELLLSLSEERKLLAEKERIAILISEERDRSLRQLQEEHSRAEKLWEIDSAKKEMLMRLSHTESLERLRSEIFELKNKSHS